MDMKKLNSNHLAFHKLYQSPITRNHITKQVENRFYYDILDKYTGYVDIGMPASEFGIVKFISNILAGELNDTHRKAKHYEL